MFKGLNLVLVAVLGFCQASIFGNGLGLKKLASLRNEVQNFKIMDVPEKETGGVVQQEAQDLLEKLRGSLLLRGAPLAGQSHNILPLLHLLQPAKGPTSGVRQPVQLQGFKIKNCSETAAKGYQFVVRSLDVEPEPLVLPGKVTFQNITFDVRSQLGEMLKIKLDIWQLRSGQEIHVPCFGMIGSCDYKVCDLLRQVPKGGCPQELVKAGFKCQCPFKKNIYHVDPITAAVDGAVFGAGDYRVQANMTLGSQSVGCNIAYFSFDHATKQKRVLP